ncbi:MAG TPA: Ig-like domain-containing protein, partial [Pyrinomonadaceae bacterium]|nr:Ig-like domain-containing protein [Pyrinomonadaceae bacterium]
PPVLDTSEELPPASAPHSPLRASAAGLAAPAPLVAAPTNLGVSQTSSAQINLSWNPSAGAHHYRVERAERINGAVTFLGDTTQSNFQDTTVAGARAYLYRILAVDAAGNFSQASTLALGAAVTFTDDPLVARETLVKAQHLTELRQAINAARRAASLPDAAWAEATITPRVTRVRAAHVQELRDRLNEALAALSIPAVTFTDAALGGALIKRAHFEELRQRATRGSSGVSGGVSVALTSPSNNALLGDGAGVQLKATVTGGSVAKVEFFRGQTKLGEDTSSPYAFVWAGATEGSHALTAVATDTFGARTESPAVGVSVVNFPAARLDAANRTGGEGVDMVSRNYRWSLPVVGLPGRSGLDLGLSLSLNSLVWTKSASHILFDPDSGFPAPGFILGFPSVQQKFYNAQASKPAYLLVTPAGARVELRQAPTSTTTYEAVDSSYLQLTENSDGSLSVRTTEGMRMSYRYVGGAFRCVEIGDPNGNTIAVTLDDFGNVTAVTDTLGRVVNFAYDAGRLQAITQAWRRETAAGTTVTETRNWARFFYADKTVQTNFDGLTPLGAQNGQTFRALTRVRLDDGSSFTFNYTSWGQVNRIAHYAADNRLLNYVSYNLPADASTPQGDCPRFTEERVWAAFWNGDDDGLPEAGEEAAFVYSPFDFAAGEAAQTAPDGTVRKEFYETAGWQRGLTTRTETFAAADLSNPQKWTTHQWTQDDTGLAYRLNPRAEETHVHDSNGNHRRTRVSYTSFGLPQDIYEYAADATTVLRRTHVSYLAASVTAGGAYASRRIIGLPEETTVFGRVGTQERLASKLTVEYDLTGEYLEAVAAATPGHDAANYGASFLVRGNACRVKRWDVDAPADATKTVKTETGYNAAGSVVFTRDALGHKTVVSYLDSDGGATLAYPTKVTDPENFSATREYNYDLGLVTRTADAKGAARKTLFDARGRAERVTAAPGGAYTRWEYPASGRFVRQFVSVAAGPNETVVETSTLNVLDGAGRMRAALRHLPEGYAGQRFVFDSMARRAQQSNAIAVTVDETDLTDVGAWEPAGDDDPAEGGTGWVYTTQTFDWQGRPLVVTNPGDPATTREFSYGGCGCAGGQTVLTRDEVGRRQKIFHDVLGRVTKAQDLTAQAKNLPLTSAANGGDVYRTVSTAYNGLDKVVETQAHAGNAAPTDQTKIQKTTLAYDGHGRLKSRHLPR